jgi:hypothetical protein
MCLINKILADLRGQERGSRILDCTNAFEDVGALELARGSAVLDDYVREEKGITSHPRPSGPGI